MPEHGQKINCTYRDWREVEGRVPHSVYCRSQEEEDSIGCTKDIPEDLSKEISRIEYEIDKCAPIYSHEIKTFGDAAKLPYCYTDGKVGSEMQITAMIKIYGLFSSDELSRISFNNVSFSDRFTRIAKCVISVKTYNNRVVLVRFADGTFTKFVCASNDTFDIDTGIMVCLIKKLLGDGGTKIYNDALRHIHKVMDRNEKNTKIAKERKAQRKAENIRINAEKKAAKERKRQERIDEMAEAIKLANIRINAEKKAAKERKRQERIEEMAEAIKLANKKEES